MLVHLAFYKNGFEITHCLFKAGLKEAVSKCNEISLYFTSHLHQMKTHVNPIKESIKQKALIQKSDCLYLMSISKEPGNLSYTTSEIHGFTV